MRAQRRTRVLASILLTSVAFAGSVAPVEAARSFKNCTAMHTVYKHGVGQRYARDQTSGTPVTTFKRSNALYRANKHLDRDGDKVACEQA